MEGIKRTEAKDKKKGPCSRTVRLPETTRCSSHKLKSESLPHVVSLYLPVKLDVWIRTTGLTYLFPVISP